MELNINGEFGMAQIRLKISLGNLDDLMPNMDFNLFQKEKHY